VPRAPTPRSRRLQKRLSNPWKRSLDSARALRYGKTQCFPDHARKTVQCTALWTPHRPRAFSRIAGMSRIPSSRRTTSTRTDDIAAKWIVFKDVPSQEIIRNKQADHSARWLAGIHFKNTIGKHWKTRAGHRYAFKGAALPPHMRSVAFRPHSVAPPPLFVTSFKGPTYGLALLCF
jgi:hypothetical protein